MVQIFQSFAIQKYTYRNIRIHFITTNWPINTFLRFFLNMKIRFIWIRKHRIYVLLHNTQMKHCFTSFDMEINNIYDVLSNINIRLIPWIKKCDFVRHYSFKVLQYLFLYFEHVFDYNGYYRPPEGGRLYDMKVVSGYAFLRTYYV